MISFTPINSPHVINNHISAQIAASYSGYSLQYLRRLLRHKKLEGIKIGQLWLVEKCTFDQYIKKVQGTTDQRFGPRL
jgi:excisionase family DNA binding protein